MGMRNYLIFGGVNSANYGIYITGSGVYEAPERVVEKVTVPTVFTAAPDVLEAFAKTPYADRLKATGVITSYICPLMYMNNPLSEKMPVITSSNKLRTYTSARYYTDEEILEQITAPGRKSGRKILLGRITGAVPAFHKLPNPLPRGIRKGGK